MKRLIIFIGLAFAFIGMQAQDAVVRNGYAKYTTDVDVAATTESTVDFLVDVDHIYRYAFQVAVDSAGDGTDITVRVKGSNDNTNWINVGSAITYGVTTTDTVMNFTNVPSSESHGIAAYNIYHDYDTTNLTGGVYADTVSVAAQTITVTTQFPVMYRLLQVSFTGAGAGAACTVQGVYLVIKED